MGIDDLRAQAWAALDRLQQQWQGSIGIRPVFDSMGRSISGGVSRIQWQWDSAVGRVERVQAALEQSGPVARGLLAQRLAGIDLQLIWHILLQACKDIALYYGGSVVAGTTLGGIGGFFVGGVGAVPGAMAGAAAGSQLGIWVLTLLGLKSLAEYVVDALPRAMQYYEQGFRRAWGDGPQGNRPNATAIVPSAPNVPQAAADFGNGHVIVIAAVLMALVAYLTRGKGDKGALLKEIRQSPRLGPKVANWVQANEGKLVNHPVLNPRSKTAAPHQPPSRPQAQTPSQMAAKSPPRAAHTPTAAPNAAPAPPPAAKPKSIKDATTAEKGVFGEAKADERMIQDGFEKMNGAPVNMGDAPKGQGIDGVWRNTSPPPDYVITEAKYGSGRLATLKDGSKQMSDDWIDDRLNKEVGRREADRIRDAMAEGRVEKRLLKVDENGNVTSTLLRD